MTGVWGVPSGNSSLLSSHSSLKRGSGAAPQRKLLTSLFSLLTVTGGIAQLVERQLCKLDAAGSSPAASTS
jgi:hypothetical protein